jgi:hypothetical protein
MRDAAIKENDIERIQANSISPDSRNVGLRASQELNLHGRSAQQESRSESAPIANSSRCYHGDFYGIRDGGQ